MGCKLVEKVFKPACECDVEEQKLQKYSDPKIHLSMLLYSRMG
jgi:hypothetical protein